MAAEILSRLVSIPELKVVSVRRVQGQDSDAKQVGRDFDVAAVLEGDVRREGNRVRVTARLTNTETGQVMWASRAVRSRTGGHLRRPEQRRASDCWRAEGSDDAGRSGRSVERRPTENVEAYDAYLRGVDYYRRSQEERDMRAAVASFERAVDLDPTFAAAHAMLSRVHSACGGCTTTAPRTAWPLPRLPWTGPSCCSPTARTCTRRSGTTTTGVTSTTTAHWQSSASCGRRGRATATCSSARDSCSGVRASSGRPWRP